jgi:hypothetical protein
MFKLALRCADSECSQQCLQKLSAKASSDLKFLYACVLEAQEKENREIAVRALQLLLDNTEAASRSDLYVPAILRCAIRLIILQLKHDETGAGCNADAVAQLCRLFDGGMIHPISLLNLIVDTDLVYVWAQRVTKGDDEWSKFGTDELDWFSRNSYNLALKCWALWDAHHTISIVRCCLNFIGLYPSSVDNSVAEDVRLRHMICDFIMAVLLISVARSESNVETQLQDYLNIRKHVASFEKLLSSYLLDLDERSKENLIGKLGKLLVFDFEALVKLRAWDAIDSTIAKAAMCKSVDVFKCMADCLLSAKPPRKGR